MRYPRILPVVLVIGFAAIFGNASPQADDRLGLHQTTFHPAKLGRVIALGREIVRNVLHIHRFWTDVHHSVVIVPSICPVERAWLTHSSHDVVASS